MTAKDRLSLATVAAMLTGGISLTPLTQDRTFLLLAGLMLLASAAIGAFARRRVSSELIVRLVQLAPVLALPVLVPATRHPLDLAFDTATYLQDAIAPMPFHTGFLVCCVLVIWVGYLIAETLAIGLRLPGWTFGSVFLPFVITAQFAYLELPAWQFCLAGAGYALILGTAARNSLAEDGRGWLSAAVARRRGVATAAVLSTAAALTASLVVGTALPERTRNWSLGGGPVQLSDPSLDLIRNLNSTSDQTIISYQSTSEVGQYLRLAALPVLDDTGFHLAATELAALPITATRPLPGSREVTTTVSVGEFASEYLPTPWAPSLVTVSGNWRWDPDTLAIVAVGDGRRTATRKVTFEATSRQQPSLERLAALPTETDDLAEASPTTLELPAGLSAQAQSLVEQLTDDADTPAAKTLALRDYLRSDQFSYSTASVPATTIDSLNDFLFGSRIGYCEQFAGALAVLARVAQIPSRVVIGFLPGRKTNDVWEITPRNMHAWTEVYLGSSLGWVSVDATPPGAVGGQSSTSPTASPSSASPTTATPTPSQPTASASAPPQTAADDSALPEVLALLALGLIGAAVVVFGPSLARRLLQARRLSRHRTSSGQPNHPAWQRWEDAWDEVRAVALDLRIGWPQGSTRTVATTLAPRLDPATATALRTLAEGVEQQRYAPSAQSAELSGTDLTALVGTITTGLRRSAPTPSSWLDRWWPRSLWPRTQP